MKKVLFFSLACVLLLLSACGKTNEESNGKIEPAKEEKKVTVKQEDKKKEEKTSKDTEHVVVNQNDKESQNTTTQNSTTNTTTSNTATPQNSEDAALKHFDGYLGTWYYEKNPAFYLTITKQPDDKDILTYTVYFYQDNQLADVAEVSLQPNGVGLPADGGDGRTVAFQNDSKTYEPIITYFDSASDTIDTFYRDARTEAKY